MESIFLPEIAENKFSIKDEIDSDRSANLDGSMEEAENQTIFPEPNTKCGEILFGLKSTFTFTCAICAKCFETLEKFGVHIQDMHIRSKELYEHIVIEDACIETVKDTIAENKEFIETQPTESNLASDTDSQNESESQQLENESNTNEKHSSQQPIFKREAFVCKLCSRAYADQKSYLSHAKQVHGILTARMRNKLRRQVRRRVRNVGEGLMENVENMENRSDSEASLTEGGEANEFPCTLCNNRYGHKRSLQVHMRKKHANGDEPKENIEVIENKSEPLNSPAKKGVKIFSCPLCKSCYSHRRSLLAHLRKIHNKYSLDDLPDLPPSSAEVKPKPRKGEYACHICERAYDLKDSLNQHIKKIHEKKRIAPAPCSSVCRYCDKVYDDLEALQLHVEDDHPGDKKYVCPYCPKLFKWNHVRRIHIYTHTGERPYKCTYCSWAFSHMSNLKMHIKMHLDIKKFPCSMCGKLFISGFEKRRHETTHTGEKLYQCEECGKRYNSLSMLKQHIHRHKNIRNYECEICQKRFYSSRVLRGHMTTHTKARPFSCSVCGQSFPRRKALKVHEQLHSDEKKYVCGICGKAFAQYAGLYAHRKSHGGIN